VILSLSLPKALANAVQLEAARTGQSPAAWLLDRLHDRFGLSHAASASRVPAVDPATERRT
jgi:hypothetical protein